MEDAPAAGGLLPQLERAGELARHLGLELSSLDRLAEALVHGSYLNENPDYRGASNERLEFLGDAVIGLVVGAELFACFPDYPEGRLTALRASLVRRETLAVVAERLALGSFLLLGRGEEAAGSRQRPAVLSCALEAVVGAIWLDLGYDQSRRLILEWLAPEWLRFTSGELEADPKSRLQQLTQARRLSPPAYHLVSADGPDHARVFTIEVRVGDQTGVGHGRSKQAAEMEAARELLSTLMGAPSVP
jgi:ribonuclease-3